MADDFKKKLEAIGKQIEKEFTSKENLKKIGDEAVGLIVKRTKLGYGVNKQLGTKQKLKPLSAGYKKIRKKLALSGTTTVSKSNLTQTGDMLKELRAKVGENSIEIGFEAGDSLDKAEWNVDNGRIFNNLSQAEFKQLEDFLIKQINDKIKIVIK
jgi:hypothetical protein